MQPEVLGGMIFTLLLALLVGGFIVLYPISRRVGALLEARLQARGRQHVPPSEEELLRMRGAVAQLGIDMQRLMDRQDFMEKLLAQRVEPRPIAPPPPRDT